LIGWKEFSSGRVRIKRSWALRAYSTFKFNLYWILLIKLWHYGKKWRKCILISDPSLFAVDYKYDIIENHVFIIAYEINMCIIWIKGKCIFIKKIRNYNNCVCIFDLKIQWTLQIELDLIYQMFNCINNNICFKKL